jgi:hypothetical protein
MRSIRSGGVDLVFRFVCDSLLEGDSAIDYKKSTLSQLVTQRTYHLPILVPILKERSMAHYSGPWRTKLAVESTGCPALSAIFGGRGSLSPLQLCNAATVRPNWRDPCRNRGIWRLVTAAVSMQHRNIAHLLEGAETEGNAALSIWSGSLTLFGVVGVSASTQLVVVFPLPEWGFRSCLSSTGASAHDAFSIRRETLLPVTRVQKACPAIAMLANALRRGVAPPHNEWTRTALRRQLDGLELGYSCRL